MCLNCCFQCLKRPCRNCKRSSNSSVIGKFSQKFFRGFSELEILVVDEGDDRQDINDENIEPKRKIPAFKIPKIKKPSKPWCSSCTTGTRSCAGKVGAGCLKVKNLCGSRTTHVTCVCCAKKNMETIEPVMQSQLNTSRKGSKFQKIFRNFLKILKLKKG